MQLNKYDLIVIPKPICLKPLLCGFYFITYSISDTSDILKYPNA